MGAINMAGRTPKKVTQLDIETGKIIAIHKSISKAAEATGLENEEMIRRALCRTNGVLQKYILRFRYFKEGDSISSVNRKRKVRQLDYETGELIEEYSSITEAAEDNWLTYDALSSVLNAKNGLMPIKKLRFEYSD